MKQIVFISMLFICQTAIAQTPRTAIATAADKMEAKIIAWRRDLHQNPELSNRETRTAAIVAKHLQSLGVQVTTGVAKTGVVGLLVGGQPGPVVALRADMDALPVLENTGLPFASKAKSTYNSNEVPVMHACGHDAHVAILMGVACHRFFARHFFDKRARRHVLRLCGKILKFLLAPPELKR